MTSEDQQLRQNKLETMFKFVMAAIIIASSAAIIAIFVQIYSINAKINSEVQQIQAAQKHNRTVTDSQNGVILNYLICIGSIPPEKRTGDVINNCVDQAKSPDVDSKQ